MYLGSAINTQDSSMQIIKRRLAVTRNATTKMGNIWDSWNIYISPKLKLLCATAFTITSYRCESQALTKREKHWTDAFEMWAIYVTMDSKVH